MRSNLNQEQMFRYLLDNLSDEDRRSIEERYLSDDEYFELLSAAEDDLITLYLDGRLPEHDRRRFESLYSRGPRRQKVEALSRIRRFALHSTPKTPPATERSKGRFGFGGLLLFALAPSGARGAGEPVLVEAPSGSAEIGLNLELDPADDYVGYELRLKPSSEDQVLWQCTDYQLEQTDESRFLLVRLPLNVLKDYGRYVLYVTGIGADRNAELLEAYAFTFRYV